jgi:5-formyltetrahydrofolate cyclo-ligase
MAGGRTLCYPRIRGRELDFYSVSGPWTLEKSVYGLREPSEEAVRIKPGELDLVIVPGMAFTRCGIRLGRGGGFYDRFLGNMGTGARAVRMGVCFEWQLLDRIPEEPHDSRMDLVVTEAGVYSGGTSSNDGIRVNTGSPSSQMPK